MSVFSIQIIRLVQLSTKASISKCLDRSANIKGCMLVCWLQCPRTIQQEPYLLIRLNVAICKCFFPINFEFFLMFGYANFLLFLVWQHAYFYPPTLLKLSNVTNPSPPSKVFLGSLFALHFPFNHFRWQVLKCVLEWSPTLKVSQATRLSVTNTNTCAKCYACRQSCKTCPTAYQAPCAS